MSWSRVAERLGCMKWAWGWSGWGRLGDFDGSRLSGGVVFMMVLCVKGGFLFVILVVVV